MMKRLCLSILLIFNCFLLLATHNRAGEITYSQLSAYTFEVTVTTYTYTESAADRTELEIEWGDNSVTTIYRISETILPNFYKRNVYVAQHTYPGPGIYRVLVQDPNRNLGVENIPNSVNVVFSITTTLTVNATLGLNNTPVLYNPPYDKAAVGYVFIHNPGAYDADGDSLSYSLTSCTRDDGKPIEGYTLPPASDSIGINASTGDLVWSTPMTIGKYNVALEVSEWRSGLKTSAIVRDMQIDVFETDNRPPVVDPVGDRCIEVGENINVTLSASDPNGDMLTISTSSGALSLAECSAVSSAATGSGSVSTSFNWTPCHEAVRMQPYNVLVKADDNNSDVNLVDFKSFNVKVLGPSPVLTGVSPEGKSIRVVWNDYGTDVIAGFNIYRREGVSDYQIDSCTAGLPSSSGFARVGFQAGSSSTSFIDYGNSGELEFGKEYTYRVVAVYANGTESKPSNELTTSLISGMPVMRNVSVVTTDQSNGSIYVAWSKPSRLDTIPNATGPYEYRVFRAEGTTGDDFTLIRTIPTTDLNDTILTDELLNTRDLGYNYRVELWNVGANTFILGEPGYASSLFITGAPGDEKVRLSFAKSVPWMNSRYVIYRANTSTLLYDSVGYTDQTSYIDEGLVNGESYNYYVKSYGGYPFEGMPTNLVNLSEIISVTPIDNEAPCPPIISVSSDCENLFNNVAWTTNGGADCDDDIAGFIVYYKGLNDESLRLLTTIDVPTTLFFRHEIVNDVISGCYSVSSFDAVGNESEKSTMICVDSCNFYEIPNVFTPNGDGLNDYLVAKTSGLVEKVDFKLFGRTGVQIFSTDEPKLNWDGTYKGKLVSSGVYFYQCDVFEWRMSGLEQFHLSGFVHVVVEKGAEVMDPITY